MLAGGVLFPGMLALGVAGGLGAISEQWMSIGLLALLVVFWALAWELIPPKFLAFAGWTTKWKIAAMPLALAAGLEMAMREHMYVAFSGGVCIAGFWLYVDILRFKHVLKSDPSNSAGSIRRGPN